MNRFFTNTCRKSSTSSIVTPLISDPLKFDNTRKLRDTSTRFPRPNLVSFDAFGTLYVPKIPVHEQYHEIASKLGFNKLADSIKADFGKLHSQLLEKYPNYGKKSGEIHSCDQWWLELIVQLFQIDHYSKNETSQELCNQLIHRFKSADGYHLFPDVIPTLSKLKEKDIKIVISSNSDTRVFDVLSSFGLFKYIDKEDVYISYNVGYEKPQKKFFDAVVNDHFPKVQFDKSAYLSNVWHVGDGHDKDYVGAVRAGWNGIYLDREVESRYLTEEMPDPESQSPLCMGKTREEFITDRPAQIIANNRVIISDLTQLVGLFKL